MLNKQLIKQLNKEGKSYAQLAIQFGVSNQRIHQIVKEYKTLNPKNSDDFRIRRLVIVRDGGRCTLGEKCSLDKKAKLHVHHLDGNSHNNELDNLITLCFKCHAYVHLLENEYQCVVCKKSFSSLDGNLKNKNCSDCEKYKKVERNKYWSYKHKLFACKSCGESTSRHAYNGICIKCEARQRYQNPKFRETHSIAQKKWNERNREKLLKKMKEYNKIYYARPEVKERVKLYAKEYKIKNYEKLKARWTENNRKAQAKRILEKSLSEMGGAGNTEITKEVN